MQILKDDFKFIKHETPEGHNDYWFKIGGKTQEELDIQNRDIGFICVDSVVYSKDEDIVGIKRIFQWNWDVVISYDENIKRVLKELVREVENTIIEN